jgi:hypothetical protein
MNRRSIVATSLLLLLPTFASAQRPDTGAMLAAQRAALRRLPAMGGVWRGTARILLDGGKWLEHTHTERVGPMLDSTLMVIEGLSYDESGKRGFNAFAVISWDSFKQAYAFHSYASGFQGDFAFTPSDTGYVWEMPAGPMTIRYAATVRDGKWREVGDRIVPGQEPVRFIELNLARVGPTDWPAAGAVRPK